MATSYIPLKGLKSAGPKEPSKETPKGMVAGYMPPSMGPFECQRCEYFDSKTSLCKQKEVVKELGPAPGQKDKAAVDAKGCCNHFEPSGK